MSDYFFFSSAAATLSRIVCGSKGLQIKSAALNENALTVSNKGYATEATSQYRQIMIQYDYKHMGGVVMFALKETIRPSADLRNHYNEISKQCHESNSAVIITVNGRGDTVSLSYEEYGRMKSRLELLEILAEAEEDVRNGRVAPIQDTFDDLRTMLKEGQF